MTSINKQLDRNIQQQFIDALLQLSVTDTFSGRSSLLEGLPRIDITRSQEISRLDLNHIISGFVRLGRDTKTGVRPLIVIADNAMKYIQGWQGELSSTFKEIIQELELYYGGEIPAPSVPPLEPEKLLFKGRDERVPFVFVQKALETSKSICRLRVPRIFGGNAKDDTFGTAWIIAPGILITNHHVIEARDRSYESPATPEDFQLQAENLTAWFDFLSESGSYLACQNAELLASNQKLDYAIVRLKESEKIADRKPLCLVEKQPELERGYRLNIIQHPRGGPLIYAIRNNFYIGTGANKDFLRYLTDTEGGSSGSPVLNDYWKVIGLHHAATCVPQEYYANLPQERYQTLPQETVKGEVITFHNEGIAIHAVLNDLSPELRHEIKLAQDWE
ncbi:serine protease [Nostoc sp. KVJ3]|uniref:trypsin-like serine peptidase n=1 Tax=Nostoc sp. KVJ3 TaxID=457945 RepID=UPI002236FF0D|nr:serine protease [Nostoc sp. KVJ3]MCW5319487.1 serine protease [Nostoc sp. KVJ3]